MGALDYLKRIASREDDGGNDGAPMGLTPIDLAWIEHRVAATLRANGVTSAIEDGWLHLVDGASRIGPAISLAGLGEELRAVDRSCWAPHVWDWCARFVLASPDPSQPVPAPSDQPAGRHAPAATTAAHRSLADVLGPTARRATDPTAREADHAAITPLLAGSIPATPPVPADEIRPAPATTSMAAAGPDPTQPGSATVPSDPADPAGLVDLAANVGRLTLRMVSDERIGERPRHGAPTAGIATELLMATALPGTSAVLAVGDSAWVTADDLEAWGISREIALGMAEANVRASRPEVTIVLVDESIPVHVVETAQPNAAALLPYLDELLAAQLGAPLTAGGDGHSRIVVFAAVANDHVLYVHAGPEATAGRALRTLVDAVVAEHDARPGLVTPAVYRWREGGRLDEIASGVHRPAGRLAARATAVRVDAEGLDAALTRPAAISAVPTRA